MFEKIKHFFLKVCVKIVAIFIRDKVKRRMFRRNILYPQTIHLPYSYIMKPFYGSTENIGKYCSIATSVHLGLDKHPLGTISTSPTFYPKQMPSSKSPVVEHDVWIGCGAIIMNDVTIHTGAVVGAGAVVTKDVPPYAIVGGVPAKIIRYRFDAETIEQLLKSEWWNYPKDVLKNLSFEDPKKFLKELKSYEEQHGK